MSLGCLSHSAVDTGVRTYTMASRKNIDLTFYGDITKISPKGASARTASQDNLKVSGVAASQALVDADEVELNKLKDIFVRVGESLNIYPALIGAIASRESRAGRLIKSTNGYGDNGNGYGIMQCDINTSGVDYKKHAWNSEGHIRQATEDVLIPKIRGVQNKHPTWTKEQQLQGGIAAYNFGVKNVQTVAGTDGGTTGDDYSNDVIARAQHLINSDGW
ncbi:glycine, glutamate and proline-rich protein-like [Haliotis rubra]|uniref:glycine, glutamate and proline-rich protein-like n=1 Tax=Haliotis rubra TaxID=36100 RepID=UPI001EE5A5CC|nr:glycine, glutamate and proline-rich protein-like [Haliotis rubra]